MYHTLLSTSLRLIFCPPHHPRHRHPPDRRHRFGGTVRWQAQRWRHGAVQGDGPGGGRVGPLACGSRSSIDPRRATNRARPAVPFSKPSYQRPSLRSTKRRTWPPHSPSHPPAWSLKRKSDFRPRLFQPIDPSHDQHKATKSTGLLRT